MTGDILVADDFHAVGQLDFADVDGLAEFQAGDVHDDLFRQILGQGADFELEQDVFEHAAAVFHAGGLANGFHRHLDGDLLVFGDFVEIHVQHLAVERIVLDFLHEREAFGARVVFDGQIHEQVFGGGMVDQIAEFLRADFEVLRLGLAAVNDRRHAAGAAQLSSLHPVALACADTLLMALISFSKIKLSFAALTGAPAFEFKQRIHRRIAVNPLDGFTQKSRHGQRDNLHTVNWRALDCISCNQFVNH